MSRGGGGGGGGGGRGGAIAAGDGVKMQSLAHTTYHSHSSDMCSIDAGKARQAGKSRLASLCAAHYREDITEVPQPKPCLLAFVTRQSVVPVSRLGPH